MIMNCVRLLYRLYTYDLLLCFVVLVTATTPHCCCCCFPVVHDDIFWLAAVALMPPLLLLSAASSQLLLAEHFLEDHHKQQLLRCFVVVVLKGPPPPLPHPALQLFSTCGCTHARFWQFQNKRSKATIHVVSIFLPLDWAITGENTPLSPAPKLHQMTLRE